MAVDLILFKPKSFQGMLVPSSVYDAELLADRIDPERDLMVRITQARNAKRHRFYFAILNAVAQSHMHYEIAGVDTLRNYIMHRLGEVELFVFHDGTTQVKAKSIAWNVMGEEEFKHLLDRTLKVIETEILPGVNRDDLLAIGKEASERK